MHDSSVIQASGTIDMTASRAKSSSSDADTRTRSRRVAVLCAVMLGASMFSVYTALAYRFDSLKAFSQHNVLFHADPMFRIRSFSTGWGWGDRNLIHPNLGNYFSLPNRVTSHLIVAAGLHRDKEQLQRFFAKLLVPTFAAGTVVVLFATVWLIGFSTYQSTLVGLLAGFSFSQLIFGSMPDHFAIGAFCMAVACLLAVMLLRDGVVRWLPWVALGVFTMGITITNVAWIGIYFVSAQLFTTKPLKTVLLHSSIWSVIVVVLTLSSAEIGRRVLKVPANEVWTFGETASLAKEERNAQGVSKLLSAPVVITRSLAPGQVATMKNDLALFYGFGREFRFTLENTRCWLQMCIVVPLMLLGTSGCLARGGPLRSIGIASLLVLLGNLTFHAMFGKDEYFAYAAHWLVPSIVLAAGVFHLPQRVLPGVNAVMAVVCGLLVLNNVRCLNAIFETLSRTI